MRGVGIQADAAHDRSLGDIGAQPMLGDGTGKLSAHECGQAWRGAYLHNEPIWLDDMSDSK